MDEKQRVEMIRQLFIEKGLSYSKIVKHLETLGIKYTRSAIAGICRKNNIRRNPVIQSETTKDKKPATIKRSKVKKVNYNIPKKIQKFFKKDIPLNDTGSFAVLPKDGCCKFPIGKELPFSWCNQPIYKKNYCEEHFKQCHIIDKK